MDPEAIQKALETAARLRSEGMSEREINSLLRRSDLPVNSLLQLQTEARAEGLVGARGESLTGEGQDRSKVADVLRRAGQGLTMGGGDELAGLVAALGAAVPGGMSPGEAFKSAQQHASQNLREAKENAGAAGLAAEVAGGLLPLVTFAPAAFRGLLAAPGKAKAAAGALRSGAAKEGAKRVGRKLPGLIRESAKGAAAGAGVGGGAAAAEIGLRAEGDVGERLQAVADEPLAVAGGGLLGGAIGGVARGVPAIRERVRAPEQSGQVLADAVRAEGRVSGRASNVEEAIGARKQQAREGLLGPLEARGRDLPIEATETLLKNPVLQKHAEAIAPRVVKSAAGEGASVPVSAEELLAIRRSVDNQASAFRQAAGRDVGAGIDPIDVRKAEDALEKLDNVMQDLEGFPEFQAAWAREKNTGRALITGRKLAGRKGSDDMKALWEGRTPADNQLKKQFPNGLPADPQVRNAFREGVATELIADLEEGQQGVKAFIDKARTGSQTREKLKIALGGEEPLNRFLQAVEAEADVMSKSRLAEELVKAGGFLLLQTSLFGGAAIELLL